MPGPRGLVQRVDQELHQSGLLPRGARLLVAVSGGADSVALLRLLREINRSNHWNWELAVAHVDHGIRGPASAADARFVRDLANTLELPFLMEKHKLPRDASEDAARQARLGSLKKMCAAKIRGRKPYDGVVTAHHADDQAETVLMRIFRGTGIDGLSGIAGESRVEGLRLLRPLLNVRRMELRAFLGEMGQNWREDQTNASTRYLRNRVRATVMPMLDVIWPQGVAALGRLATLAGETQEAIDAAVAGCLYDSPMKIGKSDVKLSRGMLRKAPLAVASEILRRAIEAAGGTSQSADFERIRLALRLARGGAGGKRIEVGRGIALLLEGDVVRIARARPSRGRGKRGGRR